MRGSRIAVLITIAMLALCGRAGAEDNLVAGGRANAVTARDVRASDGMVTGVLENDTSHVVRDVRLMIHHAWFWKNEYAPGDDNPGRVEYSTISETIEPHGTLTFRYKPSPPLPVGRTDGRFETTVSIVGYTEVGR